MTNSGMNSSVESMAHTHTGVRASIRMPGHDTALEDAITILDSLLLVFSSSYLTHILPCPPFKKSIFCFFSFLFKSEKSKLRLIATAAKTDKSQGVPQHGLVLNGVTFWDFLSIFPTVLFHFFFFFNLRIVNRN